MGIYRGIGGTGDSTSDATLEAVTQKAVEAEASADAAAISETNAAASASSAQSYAGNAATSATAAAASAVSANSDSAAAEAARLAAVAAKTAAETAETNAETAQTAAETAETNAETAATNAASSASTATTQASNAASSATSAATSASSASTSATTATTKASEAATSATNAASSATSAATSASTATAAKDAALAALDSFDDRYLGAKASDPSVDNDGNALVPGALYYNTTDDVMKVYEGSVWVAAYASVSGALLVANNLSDVASASTSRTNLGLGTVATQNANAVAITGGNIDGAPLGATTPAAGTFTTLLSNGVTTFTNGTTIFSVEDGGGTSSQFRLIGPTASLGRNRLHSPAQMRLTTNNNPIQFHSGAGTTINSDGNAQFSVSHTASAVNYVQVTGAATANAPALSFQGSDTNISGSFVSKGSGTLRFLTNTTIEQLRVLHTGSAVNYLTATGSATGNAAALSVAGTDTNISQVFQSKGTGAIDLAAGSSGVNISNGGTVTAITRTAAGTFYTSIPTLTVSPPTTAGGVQATATPQMAGQTVTVQATGTGYVVGNTLTVVGGTSSATAQLRVDAINGSGGVTATSFVNSAGAYSVLPTNPVSVTGGAGSGATFNITQWFFASVGPIITNAGSGYVEQPTVSFSGGGGSGAAAYARVGSDTVVRTLGANMSFYTPAGEQVRIVDSGNTSTSFMNLRGGVGGCAIFPTGASSEMSIGSSGGFNLRFFTSATTNEQFRISNTASAVNYVQVTGNATTGTPIISGQGSDTNVNIGLVSKGSGEIRFASNSSGSNINFRVLHTTSSAVNYGTVTGAAAGASPVFSVNGSDTNIDLTLTPKGTGVVKTSGTGLQLVGSSSGYVGLKGAAAAGSTTYTLPAADGTSGQVLSTNGSGVMSWASASATPASVSNQANTSTGYFSLPLGTTAQRPATPQSGAIRMNSTTGAPEWYDSSSNSWTKFADPFQYTVTYLVIAGGGGGGGYYYAGGGGAGGALTSTTTLAAGSSYTVTVGGGGSGGSGNYVGSVGGNSALGGITTYGGGGGGAWNNYSASSGGSGGGGSFYAASGNGSGTSGQGYAGSLGSGYPSYGTGGGGGGGGAGAAAPNNYGSSTAGAGGIGISSSISGSAVLYAGGGGGGSYNGSKENGAAWTYGGGQGASPGSNNQTAGATNKGGGGGGTYDGSGAAGGSGVVIISYPGAQRGTGGTVTSVGGNTIHTFTSSGTFTA